MSTAVDARPAGAPYPPPPLTRWGITWRYGLALILSAYFALNLAVLLTAAVGEPEPWPPWLDLVLLIAEIGGFIAAVVLIRYRRRWPLRIAWILAALGMFSGSSVGFAAWAYVSVCTRLRWREVLPLAAGWLAFGLVNPSTLLALRAQTGTLSGWMLVLFLSAMAMAALLGTAIYTAVGFGVGSQRRDVAQARERAQIAQQQQELRVEQGRAAERARIAREMHDVVAHRMSLVAMHAGALAYRRDLEPERMREVARGIQENANAALTELREVLGELREEQQPPAPQPSLADLSGLLDAFRRDGGRLDAHIEVDDEAEMGPIQARHAYRIIQEALTNARKHAVDAPVLLSVEGDEQRGLRITVRNPHTRDAGVPGAGLGLVGLRERAALAGGSLEAGPIGGDFVVAAWLPWSR